MEDSEYLINFRHQILIFNQSQMYIITYCLCFVSYLKYFYIGYRNQCIYFESIIHTERGNMAVVLSNFCSSIIYSGVENYSPLKLQLKPYNYGLLEYTWALFSLQQQGVKIFSKLFNLVYHLMKLCFKVKLSFLARYLCNKKSQYSNNCFLHFILNTLYVNAIICMMYTNRISSLNGFT